MKQFCHWLIANMAAPSLQNPVILFQKSLNPSTTKVEAKVCNVYTTCHAAKVYQSSCYYSHRKMSNHIYFIIHSWDSEETQDRIVCAEECTLPSQSSICDPLLLFWSFKFWVEHYWCSQHECWFSLAQITDPPSNELLWKFLGSIKIITAKIISFPFAVIAFLHAANLQVH